MPRVWVNFSKRGKYYISKHAFLTVLHFCMQYDDWLREYRDSVGLRGVQSNTSTSGVGDPTAAQAIRLEELSQRIEMIERTANEADPSLHPYLLRGVTTEGMTFDMLKAQGIPCERKMYYDRRRKFYYMMAGNLHLI